MHYLLVSIGEWFTWEAETAAKSIKHNTTDSRITLYTDTQPKRTQYFDKIIPLGSKPNNLTQEKWAKIERIKSLLDYKIEQFTHLDVDTYVIESPEPAFNQDFDLATCISIWRQTKANHVPGVLLVRKTPNTTRALRNWLIEYAESKELKDQYIFDKHAQTINTKTLDPEYCAQVGELTQYSGKIKICHRHYQTPLLNAIIPAVFLNQTHDNRIWIPIENRMISSTWSPETNSIVYKNYYVTQEHIQTATEFIGK